MNGIGLIAKERVEQIEKHGYSIEQDRRYTRGELLMAATAIIQCSDEYWPYDWDLGIYERIRKKPKTEQLAIAGAFIAAEIDSLLFDGETLHEIHT